MNETSAPPAAAPPGQRTSRLHRVVWWAIVAGAVLAVAVPHVLFEYEPYTFLIGDCPYYAQTAISIALDRDLDLRNQLKGGLEPHQRQISLGARGEWYPKHPILMPLVTFPLLPLLKMNAFLVVNLIVLAALAIVLWEISVAAAPGIGAPAAAAGSLLAIFGSFLILYDYNYSPDLFACLILGLSVLAAMRDRPGWAGLFGGLAAFARTSNLFLLPLILTFILWRAAAQPGPRASGSGPGTRWRAALLPALRFALAAGLPLAAQASLNAAMFGSPATSPYTRILSIEDGQVVLRSHMADFDNPFWDGVTGQLFDPGKGLVFTAPVLLLALPGYLFWLRRNPANAILCFGLGEFLFLLFSRYRWWPTSHQGNRFLMPLVALSAPAVACAIQWAIDRRRVADP